MEKEMKITKSRRLLEDEMSIDEEIMERLGFMTDADVELVLEFIRKLKPGTIKGLWDEIA